MCAAAFEEIVYNDGYSVSSKKISFLYINQNQNFLALTDCNGRMGNILGVMSLGLQLFLKRGVRLVLFLSQYQELMGCFDPSVCAEDGSTFCIVLPEGNFNLGSCVKRQANA